MYPLPVSQYHDQIYGHYPKPRWNTGFYGSMTRQDRVSSLSGSPKIVNVVDFGAKGNGQDDSKVHPIEQPKLKLIANRYCPFQAVTP